MKTTYYHGTNADNLDSILKHGLSCSESKIWNCSEDAVYLWEPKGCAEANGIDEEEYFEQEAFRMAKESGQIACALATDCRVVVLKIELENDEVANDCSCENMEGRGAKCIYRDIHPDEITEIKVSNDLSLIKGYFIYILSENKYADVDFNRMELLAAKAFKESCIYEELDEFIEFVTIDLMAAN